MKILLIVGTMLVFGVVNWQIASKERLRQTGEPVFFQIVPLDPRSPMQGDYMALNFAVAREIGNVVSPEDESWRTAIVSLDARRIGAFVRLDDGSPLNPGEKRLRFRVRDRVVWLGTNAFFFREGEADRYSHARYGEFRLNQDGDAILVNLVERL